MSLTTTPTTFAYIKQQAQNLSRHTGQKWSIVSFPAPSGPRGHHGYNLLLQGPNDHEPQVHLGGRSPKELSLWMDAYSRGFDTARAINVFTIAQATTILAGMLALHKDDLQVSLIDDDAEQTATDMLEWHNRTEFEWDDIKELFELFREGKFESWECPGCNDGTRVYVGQPDDWGNFQGVRQADHTSFPGNKHNQKCCDHCRMTMNIPEEEMANIRFGIENDE